MTNEKYPYVFILSEYEIQSYDDNITDEYMWEYSMNIGQFKLSPLKDKLSKKDPLKKDRKFKNDLFRNKAWIM